MLFVPLLCFVRQSDDGKDTLQKIFVQQNSLRLSWCLSISRRLLLAPTCLFSNASCFQAQYLFEVIESLSRLSVRLKSEVAKQHRSTKCLFLDEDRFSVYLPATRKHTGNQL